MSNSVPKPRLKSFCSLPTFLYFSYLRSCKSFCFKACCASSLRPFPYRVPVLEPARLTLKSDLPTTKKSCSDFKALKPLTELQLLQLLSWQNWECDKLQLLHLDWYHGKGTTRCLQVGYWMSLVRQVPTSRSPKCSKPKFQLTALHQATLGEKSICLERPLKTHADHQTFVMFGKRTQLHWLLALSPPISSIASDVLTSAKISSNPGRKQEPRYKRRRYPE